MSENILTSAKPVADTDEYITALIYGKSGSGKTTLAATFPKDILLLDIHDRGTDSIKDVDGIDVLSVQSWVDFEAVYWALKTQDHSYETVVIDTITNVQDLAMEEVKQRAGVAEDSAMSQKLWGEISRMMTQWIYHYRDLPMHVVFLAQERVRKGSDEESWDDQLDPEVGPAVIPSVAKSLCAAVKVIGNTYIQQVSFPSKKKPGAMVSQMRYMLRIGPHPYYITKVRSPKGFKLPGSLKDASFETIRKTMKGEE